MGYDLNRFTEHVENELQCPICQDVLENAVESPDCQHVFCDECIKVWLSNNSICPMDKRPLKYEEMKPINRILRNFLLRLKIKCDFEKQGCQSVVALENLQNHVTICEFNPNIEVKCEKECGLMISQNEIKTHNCISKLSILMMKLYNENNSLKDKIRELQSTQIWICSKLTVSNNNLIECQIDGGITQSRFSLDNINPYFDVKLVNLGEKETVSIELSSKCLSHIGDSPLFKLDYIIFFRSDGWLTHYNPNPTNEKFGIKWEVGDVIRCGINYQNAIKLENHIVVYLNRNNELVCEKTIKLTERMNFYPGVYLRNPGVKVVIV